MEPNIKFNKEMIVETANLVLDGYEYNGKTIREWADLITNPKTKGDHLRSMSDEELAEWIDEFWSAPWCPDEPPVDSETTQCLLHDGDCRLCILDWLRQEVEEET